MRRLLELVAASALIAIGSAPASAVELLVGGNFDNAAPQGWTLEEFLTGSAAPVDAVEQVAFANQPMEVTGERGMWFRSFTGFPNPSNGILSQSTSASPGVTYTFTGWSRWEPGYSGADDFLFPGGPYDPESTGTVPSQTVTTMELAFLNASDVVIGSPVLLDLETVQTGDNAWHQHTLVGVAPAGTARARITAAARNMQFNVDPQSAFFDNFSLTGSNAPGTEKLINGALNLPELPAGAWVLTEAPAGADTLGIIGFAAHSGSNGVWLKAFAGNLDRGPVDAILTQTVPGVAGGNYTFSGWSKWEGGYSGGVTTLDAGSPHGAIPSPTDTTLELAFLNASNAVIGTPIELDLRTVQQNDNTWRQHTLQGTAPAGTVSVRVTASALDMLANIDVGGGLGNQSAFFDDFSLQGPAPGVAGDFDGDSDVDGNDLLIIQRGIGTTTTGADIISWKANFGAGGATAATAAVPEPSTIASALACAAVVSACGYRRRIAG
jgi:hypothetical protein